MGPHLETRVPKVRKSNSGKGQISPHKQLKEERKH